MTGPRSRRFGPALWAAFCLAVAPALAVAQERDGEDGVPAVSSQHQKTDSASTEPRRVAGSLIQFRPPTRGAPTRRVGASTRSAGAPIRLQVIAPRTAAYTADPSPTLNWHVTNTDLPAVVTLIVDDRIDPVIEIPVGVPSAGLHATALADHGVRLRAGVGHEWSVALVADPQARSRDIVASARFVHHPAGPALSPDAGEGARLAALAAGGYWYDLMRALLGPDARTDDPTLVRALMDDVGLTGVAP
jgi:hypothetical protein